MHMELSGHQTRHHLLNYETRETGTKRRYLDHFGLGQILTSITYTSISTSHHLQSHNVHMRSLQLPSTARIYNLQNTIQHTAGSMRTSYLASSKPDSLPSLPHLTFPIPFFLPCLSANPYGQLATQPQCSLFSDPLIEHPRTILLIDLILLKPRVYRHLLFNRASRPAIAGKQGKGLKEETKSCRGEVGSGIDTCQRGKQANGLGMINWMNLVYPE